MKPDIKLFTIMNVTIYATPLMFVGMILAWAVYAGLAIVALEIRTGEAIIGGLILAFLIEIGEIQHQLGHATAAKQVGYPMTGVRLWLMIGTSLYPEDEPELPAKTHIKRALGGPIASAILAIFIAPIAFVLQSNDVQFAWVVSFFLFTIVAVFTVAAFVPMMGISDGSTILRYWGK